VALRIQQSFLSPRWSTGFVSERGRDEEGEPRQATVMRQRNEHWAGSSTADIYGHVTDDASRSAADAVSRALGL